MTWFGIRWDIGTATFSAYDEDGYPGVQVDTPGGEQAGAPHMEQHSLFGFLSRPLDPDASGGAQALYGWEGNRGHAFVLDDARVTPKLPQVKKGGSVQYGATGSFDLIDGEDGSKAIYVPYAFENGTAKKAMLVNLDVANAGAETLYIIHGDGMAIVMMADGKKTLLKNADGSAWIQLDADGITLSGNVKIVGGITMGDSVNAKPLVTAPGLIAYLTALEAAVTAKTPAGPPGVTIASAAAGFTATKSSGA